MLGYIDLHLTIEQASLFYSYLQYSRSEIYFQHLELIGQLRRKIYAARVKTASHIEKELDAAL